MAGFLADQILYEDDQIIVCEKEAGFPVQSARVGRMDLESALKSYLAAKNPSGGIPYLGVIHRLDQPVEGILVFAKTPQAAKNLNNQMAKGTMEKYYKAIVCGLIPEKEGTLVDYLVRNGRENMSRVVGQGTPGCKRAVLRYRVLGEHKLNERCHLSVVEVKLQTGRHHQIRVQFAHAQVPLVGDVKYNSGAVYHKDCKLMESMTQNWQQISLCAYKLLFLHPVTGKKMEFVIEPKGELFQKLSEKER